MHLPEQARKKLLFHRDGVPPCGVNGVAAPRKADADAHKIITLSSDVNSCCCHAK